MEYTAHTYFLMRFRAASGATLVVAVGSGRVSPLGPRPADWPTTAADGP